MKASIPTSQQFQPDQQFQYVVEYWNTPMTPLRNDLASNGIRMDVVEPRATDGVFTYLAAINTGAASGVDAAWDAATGYQVLTNGRIGNLIGYWAGGAPGYHGASVNRQVGYRFEGDVRSVTGRDWFSSAAPINPMYFGAVGSGYLRIILNHTTDIFNGVLTEEQYLHDGPTWSSSVSIASGDTISVYYVQDEEDWGGFVVKVTDEVLTQGGLAWVDDLAEAFREAPVLGCGLLEYTADGVLTMDTLELIESVDVSAQVGQTRRATFRVPLMKPGQNDNVGWEWLRTGGDTTGHLRAHNPDGTTVDVYRQRLIRVRMGFQSFVGVDELYPVFTGWVDDFAAQNGLVTVTCLGLEQRLADQYVKNYPDKISYMCAGYRKLEGSIDPVYAIAAYDNWPMELALRDLLVRSGIDESRTRALLTVPQADGSAVPVVM